jgi:hypothetical protein
VVALIPKQEIQEVQNHQTKLDGNLLTKTAQQLTQEVEDRPLKDDIVLQVFHHDECDNPLREYGC